MFHKAIFKFTSDGEPNVSDIAEPLCAASVARYLLKKKDPGRLKRRETSRDIPNILTSDQNGDDDGQPRNLCPMIRCPVPARRSRKLVKF